MLGNRIQIVATTLDLLQRIVLVGSRNEVEGAQSKSSQVSH